MTSAGSPGDSEALASKLSSAHAPRDLLPVEEGEDPQILRRGFRIGSLNLLVQEGTVCEILDLPPVARVPNTAPWLCGLVNRRGSVIPVYDLMLLLFGENKTNRSGRLLVIGQGEASAGVIVQALPTLETFNAEDRAEAVTNLPRGLREYVINCFMKDGAEWFEFAHEQLFLSLVSRLVVN